VVLIGYKITYKGETLEGLKPKYHRIRQIDTYGAEVTKTKFEFNDDEYIVHMGGSAGMSLDRIEFVTNLGRHFKAGGLGGRYEKFVMDCPDDKHPRVISFGFGIGPYDVQ